MIGEAFAGKYTITRLIGQGGMGSVYEARHARTARRVAIKVIAAQHAADAQLLQRFELEARATGEIESQHVAQVLDVGVDPARGTPYLVMEFLSGEDIGQILDRLGPLPPELAVRVVAQACVGLEKAHAARIVHRDVKPANIFLAERDDGDRVVKLVDFGIAKITDTQAGSFTRAGSLVGSPLYMSPEQARGAADVDHRSDIWSLGIVLYELLTGATPYDESTPVGELIISICSTPAPSVIATAPWVRPELAAVVEKALRISAKERYQSAGELSRALKPFIPQGAVIHASMLAPLDAAARAAQPDGRPASASGASSAPFALALTPARSLAAFEPFESRQTPASAEQIVLRLPGAAQPVEASAAATLVLPGAAPMARQQGAPPHPSTETVAPTTAQASAQGKAGLATRRWIPIAGLAVAASVLLAVGAAVWMRRAPTREVTVAPASPILHPPPASAPPSASAEADPPAVVVTPAVTITPTSTESAAAPATPVPDRLEPRPPSLSRPLPSAPRSTPKPLPAKARNLDDPR